MAAGALPPDFGRKLAQFRSAIHRRQAELAQAVGVDPSTISRYEGGDLTPGLVEAQRILATVGTCEATGYGRKKSGSFMMRDLRACARSKVGVSIIAMLS